MIRLPWRLTPYWLKSGRYPIWYRVIRNCGNHLYPQGFWENYLTIFGRTFKWISF